MDNLRLAQESFPSRKVALAEEATIIDVQPMKTWEIVLIVLGVAIGLMCVIFVAKQTILAGPADDHKEEDEEKMDGGPLIMEAAMQEAEAMEEAPMMEAEAM